MDVNEFRQAAKQMVDYVADYLESIRDRRPLADVQPGYLRHLVPEEAPQQPETWKDVFGDIERVIMPGVTHWHSPRFFAYFPTANSYPGIVADILSDAIGCIGFSWVASPACTELEVVMMDWLAKMLDLPQHFLSTAEGGKGGGVIHGTASEATFVALLAARDDTLTKVTSQDASQSKTDILGKLVAYCSDQAHSSVERACLLGPVRCHKVESDDRNRMTGDALRQAIEEDKAKGLVPFLCVATLGTTPSCAFDHLTEIGPVCNEYDIWLHIDAAYAGSSFICPEFRHLLNGVEFANSFNFNPHKWLQVNFDCSAMWFKDSSKVVGAFNVDPLYLKHANQNVVPDYRHWQIPLGRRFRSLKLWFVLRLYGVTGLQAIIRKDVELAKQFEEMVKSDGRFEIYGDVILGLVCFRLKGSNELNETLHAAINKDGRIHLVPSKSKGIYYLRLAICASRTNFTDISFAWKAICDVADDVNRSASSASGAHA